MRDDKDGSYSIMTNDTYLQVRREGLHGAEYEEVTSVTTDAVKRLGDGLAERVVNFSDDQQWWSAVAKGWRNN